MLVSAFEGDAEGREESAHADLDVVADGADGVDGSSRGVLELPVLMISSVQGFGNSVAMSMPTSAMARTAAWFTSLPGSEPPDQAMALPSARWLNQPSAIWDRPALWTQRNSTVGVPSPLPPGLAGINPPLSGGRGLTVGNDQVDAGRSGWRYRASAIASAPPMSWATMKAGTEDGRMPANVSLRVRPMVTAGLAKLVDDVNQ